MNIIREKQAIQTKQKMIFDRQSKDSQNKICLHTTTTNTTGKLYFAEWLRLCRVLFIGTLGKETFCRVPHSAKSSTRQRWLCRALCTRQSLALGKSRLCRVPRHSAKVPLGKRWPARDGGHLPSDFAECLTDGTRQIFLLLFLKTYFAECKPWALGKIFF